MAKQPKYSLILRTCKSDYTSHGGFQWPKRGEVSCPDWNPKPVCGGGLHGLLWGEGNAELLNWDSDAVWQVVRVPTADIIKIDSEKVKFPGGAVLYSGTQEGATSYIYEHGGNDKRVVGLIFTGGDYSTFTGGYRSTFTGGDGSTFIVRWWDGKRYRVNTASVGEGGVSAKMPYRFENGTFTRVEEAKS
jgi:hypothetical protein